MHGRKLGVTRVCEIELIPSSVLSLFCVDWRPPHHVSQTNYGKCRFKQIQLLEIARKARIRMFFRDFYLIIRISFRDFYLIIYLLQEILTNQRLKRDIKHFDIKLEKLDVSYMRILFSDMI